MTDKLIEQLRDEDSYYRVQEKHWCIDAEELERQRLAAADRIEAQAAEIETLKTMIFATGEAAATNLRTAMERAAEIERLRKAGTKLAGYAGHDDNCEIMLKGVWGDNTPCDCGYEDAWKAWGETK